MTDAYVCMYMYHFFSPERLLCESSKFVNSRSIRPPPWRVIIGKVINAGLTCQTVNHLLVVVLTPRSNERLEAFRPFSSSSYCLSGLGLLVETKHARLTPWKMSQTQRKAKYSGCLWLGYIRGEIVRKERRCSCYLCC